MTLKEFFDTSFFKQLVFDANCFNALQNGGVDNWSYYCDAYTDYCEATGCNDMEEVMEKEIFELKEKFLND